MNEYVRAAGFRFSGMHAGVKVARKDLALIVSEAPCAAAGVFTQNRMRAHCVARCTALLPAADVRAIVVNSGNANVMGPGDGASADRQMAAAVASSLEVAEDTVLTSSTGTIGIDLPAGVICDAVPALVEGLSGDLHPAAEAILTTDRVVKIASRQLDLSGAEVRITAVAKGSGMIHPNMATMLAFICTDAACEPSELQALVREVVASTFNQISVDRDTSTNDMVIALANGRSGVRIDGDPAHRDCFRAALEAICRDLARKIAADGEGATRLVSVEVSGAPSLEVARTLSRAAVSSNLFKASLYGDMSGWGRCLAAIGACAAEQGVTLDRPRIGMDVNGVREVAGGVSTGEKATVNGPEVRVGVDLGLGEYCASAWGCDLSYDYVTVNAVTKSEPLETHSPGLKRRLLVEALSYIKRFSGRVAVIKYGGAAMVREDLQDAFAEDVVLLEAAGLRPVVVHGGGPEISRTLSALGEETQFVDGMRVTGERSMRVVEMVLTGRVNTDLVTRIHRMGGDAIGISGKDGGLLTARKLSPEGRDIGLVGEVTDVRTEVITMLLDNRYIPIISPVGVDAHGATYNINADAVAAEVAAALKAEKLLFLTDVPGVVDGDEVVSQTTPGQLAELIDRGVIHGGMLPKARALLSAVERGVTSAHIIDGRVPHNLLAELFTDRGVGTWIVRD